MLQFLLKACPKCGGDLALDHGDWCCLRCGTYYYTKLYKRLSTPELLHPDQASARRRLPENPKQKEWHLPQVPLGEPIRTQAAAGFQFEPVVAQDTCLTLSWSGALTGVELTLRDNPC
ncbi:MAG: hypothetical protein BZY88_01595 [SAR202 cluster bacterium Io17-Chloro-G9]|nr:MAG: hypothetical protein BZY88_01595 [SAR202 cluster bacterium Io17-Chloro-G9]